MGLTVHRYEFSDSYIIEKLTERYKIDFSLANSFHKETIDLYYGLENLLARFFEEDQNYGTLLEPREDIITGLGVKSTDLDFIFDLCNGEPNMEIFYPSHIIYQTLKKVDDNKKFLIDKRLVANPDYLEKLKACLTFVEKAMTQNNLIHFWMQ